MDRRRHRGAASSARRSRSARRSSTTRTRPASASATRRRADPHRLLKGRLGRPTPQGARAARPRRRRRHGRLQPGRARRRRAHRRDQRRRRRRRLAHRARASAGDRATPRDPSSPRRWSSSPAPRSSTAPTTDSRRSARCSRSPRSAARSASRCSPRPLLPRLGPMRVAAWAAGSPPPNCRPQRRDFPTPTPDEAAAIAYLAVITTALAFVLWFGAVSGSAPAAPACWSA